METLEHLRTADVSMVSAAERLDVHNMGVDEVLAGAHLCGVRHLASGRVCLLPERHRGPCQLERPVG